MWYTTHPNPGHNPEERKGQKFGSLIVAKGERGWQVDHWPTGTRVWPQSPLSPIGYMTARHITSNLKNHPIFAKQNRFLYWEPETFRCLCPQIGKAVKKQIIELGG
jgi:hypothetical protein